MDPKEKKRFKKNMIRFLIGIFFFGISYIYTLAHPAPKMSMRYGLKELSQKITIFFYKIHNKDPKLLQEKYLYEDVYTELLNTAKNSSCINPNIVDIIKKKGEALKNEPNENLELNLPSYIYKVGVYKDLIKNCGSS